MKKSFFQSQMDELKFIGGDQELENIHLGTASNQFKERVILTFLENQKGLFHNLKTHFRVAGEAINDFWSMSGTFIYRHHVEPRVKLYSPREESFPIPLKYIDVSRTTHTNLECDARTLHR